jgi:hypothetical protein
MRYFIFCFTLLFFAACSGDEKSNGTVGDSLSKKDSLKRALQENLPPPTDIKQFNWIYSAFVRAAADGNDSAFNVFIHPKKGLWVIHTDGALPVFTHITKISEYTNIKGRGLLPIVFWDINKEPKDESLPTVDCDKKGFYSKEGCFSTQENKFLEEKIWTYAGLSADQDKEVMQLATTITRTVVNTANFKYYFSLIDGSWYLTFIDIRRPCEA